MGDLPAPASWVIASNVKQPRTRLQCRGNPRVTACEFMMGSLSEVSTGCFHWPPGSYACFLWARNSLVPWMPTRTFRFHAFLVIPNRLICMGLGSFAGDESLSDQKGSK